MLGLGLECEILDMRLLEEMRKKLKQTVELCGGVKSCQECPHSPHTRSWIRIYVILIRSYFLSQNFLICGSYCHMSSVQNVTQMSTKLQIIIIILQATLLQALSG